MITRRACPVPQELLLSDSANPYLPGPLGTAGSGSPSRSSGPFAPGPFLLPTLRTHTSKGSDLGPPSLAHHHSRFTESLNFFLNQQGLLTHRVEAVLSTRPSLHCRPFPPVPAACSPSSFQGRLQIPSPFPSHRRLLGDTGSGPPTIIDSSCWCWPILSFTFRFPPSKIPQLLLWVVFCMASEATVHCPPQKTTHRTQQQSPQTAWALSLLHSAQHIAASPSSLFTSSLGKAKITSSPTGSALHLLGPFAFFFFSL